MKCPICGHLMMVWRDGETYHTKNPWMVLACHDKDCEYQEKVSRKAFECIVKEKEESSIPYSSWGVILCVGVGFDRNSWHISIRDICENENNIGGGGDIYTFEVSKEIRIQLTSFIKKKKNNIQITRKYETKI